MRNKQKIIGSLVGLTLATLVLANLAYAETDTQRPIKSNQDQARLKIRAAKAQAISRLEQNQINRAQNAIDRLSQIIDRINAIRDKAPGTSDELKSIDDLILKAEKQKADAEKALSDLKAKGLALQNNLNTTASDTALPAPEKPVKDFMLSTKTLKQDLISLHQTLIQIVKQMKALNKDKAKTETTTNTNTEENE